MPGILRRKRRVSGAGENPADGRKQKTGKAGSRRAALAGGALALCLTLGWLTGIIYFFAGNAGIMAREMMRLAPPERTGLPAKEYPGMAAHMTEYLTGRKDSFQYAFRNGQGEEILCFHDYEEAHMADCRNLIRLDGIVCAACLGTALVLAAGLFRGGKRNLFPAAGGAAAALRILGIVFAGLVLWAAVNFDSLFVTFHHLAFRNDLWLLNPRTDLLIRLMPQALFVRLGAEGLGIFTAGAAVLTAAVLRMNHAAGKQLPEDC